MSLHFDGENDLENSNLKNHSIQCSILLPGSDDRISLNSDEFSSLSGNVCNSIDSRRDIDFEDYGPASDYKETPTPMYIGLLRSDYNIPSITEGMPSIYGQIRKGTMPQWHWKICPSKGGFSVDLRTEMKISL